MDRYRLKPQRLKEHSVVAACLDLLRIRGWKAHRMLCGPYWNYPRTQIVQTNPAGTPDYVCIHPHYPAFYMENKRPRGKLSPKQILQQQFLEKGEHIKVVTIDDPRALIEFLNEHERPT